MPVHPYEDDDWRGFLPVEGSGDLRLRHVTFTWVAGLPYYVASRSPAFAPESAVQLKAAQHNPHDPHAIEVWDRRGRLKAGYLPAILVAGMDDSQRTGLIAAEMVREGRRVALWMLVARTAIAIQTEPALGAAADRLASRVRKMKERAEPFLAMAVWPDPAEEPSLEAALRRSLDERPSDEA